MVVRGGRGSGDFRPFFGLPCSGFWICSLGIARKGGAAFGAHFWSFFLLFVPSRFDVKQNGGGSGLNDEVRWGVDVVGGRGYPELGQLGLTVEMPRAVYCNGKRT